MLMRIFEKTIQNFMVAEEIIYEAFKLRTFLELDIFSLLNYQDAITAGRTIKYLG